jgi:hypothetical protein
MAVRAKFKVTTITHHEQHDPSAVYATVKLQAVSKADADNKDWSKWTPSGSLEMGITNPDAISQFELGKAYYLDFTPAA